MHGIIGFMTSKLDYVIKLSYDKEYEGYVADVLNLYGCMSQGKTKKEAIKNARSAIKAYMEAAAKRVEKDSEFSVASVPVKLAIA